MENRYSGLSTQIAHGKKTNVVPIERIEFFARDGFYFINAMVFQDLKPVYENRANTLSGTYRKDLALLEDAGFGWIVVATEMSECRKGLLMFFRLCGEPKLQSRTGSVASSSVQYTKKSCRPGKKASRSSFELF